MSYSNIPQELRDLPQWVVAYSDKVPRTPRTGEAADPADAKTGGTFAEAAAVNAPHIGFILSDLDPYCIIDLDDPFEVYDYDAEGNKYKHVIDERDKRFPQCLEIAARHTKICTKLDTYTERSQSGRGVHIVMRGCVPQGARRDKIEIYSSLRYMIFTGDVIKERPIVNCQALINDLYEQIGNVVDRTGRLVEEEATDSDEAVWRMASRASNSAKFISLCEGNWRDFPEYPSQSEADHALLSILCFYSRSNEQVRRMFCKTNLYRTASNKQGAYLNYSILMIRRNAQKEADKMLDFSLLTPPDIVDAQPQIAAANHHVNAITFPPGLVGEIATYIYETAPRPVPEIALAGALALMAGFTGRAYAVSKTGLNLYIVLLAKTGCGKEGAANGIDALMNAVATCGEAGGVPMVNEFRGAGTFPSGQGLIRMLVAKPCCLSVLGEFGLTLKALCDERAGERHLLLKALLLDLYSKSGPTSTLQGSAYSDTAKNTPPVRSPNLTILGESSHEALLEGLELTQVAQGLIPRFLFIDYRGKRVPLNPQRGKEPDVELVTKLGQIVEHSLRAQMGNTHTDVTLDHNAQIYMDDFDRVTDRKINDESTHAVAVQLWNRAHLKALKVAAIVAVGVNPLAPEITGEIALWAIDLIERDIKTIVRAFKEGETTPTGDLTKERVVLDTMKKFFAFTKLKKVKAKLPAIFADKQVVPRSYLTNTLRIYRVFKDDKRGPNASVDSTLKWMVSNDIIRSISNQELREAGEDLRKQLYCPSENWPEDQL